MGHRPFSTTSEKPPNLKLPNLFPTNHALQLYLPTNEHQDKSKHSVEEIEEKLVLFSVKGDIVHLLLTTRREASLTC
jgi:hypothetical protein